jgi:hypothetical protein
MSSRGCPDKSLFVSQCFRKRDRRRSARGESAGAGTGLRASLQSGDCLLLTTDGVTEAADETDDEFGADRVTASARIARGQGAHGIRTRILEDVTQFCKGNFHDDASLMVVTVD